MRSTTESPGRRSDSSRARLIVGGSLWLVTRFTPLLIPAVQNTSLSDGIKLALSGLLVFGIPELFLLIAIAIMGRDGYRIVTRLVFRIMRKHAPPEHVSRLRYRIGLVLFCIPVGFAILSPYVGHLLPSVEANARVYALAGDSLLLLSLFVLGGEFWDKLRALFVYEATTSFPRDMHKGD
jgi:hypothetical protein